MSKKRMGFIITAMAFMVVLLSGTYFGARADCSYGPTYYPCSPCISCNPGHIHTDLDYSPTGPRNWEYDHENLDTAMGLNSNVNRNPPYQVIPVR
jgi:hypothetical protein